MSDRVDVDALKAWADTALQEAHSRPLWREGLSVGEAAGLAGDVLALLERDKQWADRVEMLKAERDELQRQLLGGARGACGGGDA